MTVPDGFATTADAHWEFLKANDPAEDIQELLSMVEAAL